MAASSIRPLDVLVVGAGPVGLMMACQLALHKIKFRIIDQRTSSSSHSGALIIHARTLEILHQMGLAGKLLNSGTMARTIHLRFNHSRHYSLDIRGVGKTLTLFPYLLLLEQWQTEQLLQQFLNEQGYRVEQGRTLTGFNHQDELVISEITTPDGAVEIIKSRFLIGADGKDSFVRNHLKIPFRGKTQKHRLFITDCEARVPSKDGEIFFSLTSDSTSGFFPLKANRWRVDGLIPGIQHKQVSFEEVGNFFNRKVHSGIELYRAHWFSVFRSHSRCADLFRLKQCFLVGDAAHVHSPVGAQGMNTGMQDAHNLAWKLAFYIHGKAHEKLLNSYEQERRPVALKTIRYTDMAYALMTTNGAIPRFFRLHLLPLLMPWILSQLNKKQHLRERLFGSVSGIGIAYKHSALAVAVPDDGFAVHSPRPGQRMPYLEDVKKEKPKTALNDLNPTHFSLFVFGIHILPQMFQSVLFKYKNVLSIQYVAKEEHTRHVFNRLGLKEQGCYLVRPDRYIAWRSHQFNAEELNELLEKILK